MRDKPVDKPMGKPVDEPADKTGGARVDFQKEMEKLGRLYRVYDRATAAFPVACKEKCDDCCTCNVVVTSLETAWLLSRLSKDEITGLRERLEAGVPEKRYQPGYTTNGFALACIEGRTLEDEENDPAWGKCPLLEDGRCTVYHARPFGCRNMMSEAACADAGYARMPELALTLNNIFLQYIEHMDYQGVSGNLTDMLVLYLKHAVPYGTPGQKSHAFPLSLENLKDSDKTGIFIRNMKIPALMIPPEHRADAAPVLDEINALGQG